MTTIAAARPLVAVQGTKDQVAIPEVFLAPIRPDIVHFVHSNMAKNRRQPYGVSPGAGHQHSAESWGTGRAVARVPRVSGGGTSRAGQGAFANMCRKGRMFAPTKIWRRWHRKINVNQKRFAVASALAASALPSLVLARGHKIEQVPEVPLVVDNSVESIVKTKKAIETLKSVGAYDDVLKVKASKKLRRGKGKLRNRRHTQRRGPLVIYGQDSGLVRAFRNLPGIELAQVDSLNLLQLAPGGHLGRFIIWTKSAFAKLSSNWGSINRESAQKSGYFLPRPQMVQSDLTRLINSDEVQSKVNPARHTSFVPRQKKNPLKNFGTLVKLNPYAVVARRAELLSQERSKHARVQAQLKARAAADKKHDATQVANYNRLIDSGVAPKDEVYEENVVIKAALSAKRRRKEKFDAAAAAAEAAEEAAKAAAKASKGGKAAKGGAAAKAAPAKAAAPAAKKK